MRMRAPLIIPPMGRISDIDDIGPAVAVRVRKLPLAVQNDVAEIDEGCPVLTVKVMNPRPDMKNIPVRNAQEIVYLLRGIPAQLGAE